MSKLEFSKTLHFNLFCFMGLIAPHLKFSNMSTYQIYNTAYFLSVVLPWERIYHAVMMKYMIWFSEIQLNPIMRNKLCEFCPHPAALASKGLFYETFQWMYVICQSDDFSKFTLFWESKKTAFITAKKRTTPNPQTMET